MIAKDEIGQDMHFENRDALIKKIKSVFQVLLKRHPILSSRFFMKGETGLFYIMDPQLAFDVEYTACDESKADDQIQAFIRPFHLDEPPLFRVGIIQTGIDNYLLLVDIHHIICDGISLQFLMDEVAELMQNNMEEPKKSGEEAPFWEYSAWLDQQLQDGRLENQRKYWISNMPQKIPEINLPFDFARPPFFQPIGNEIVVELPDTLYQSVKLYCKQYRLTEFMFFLGIFVWQLYQYTGDQQFIIGIPVSGRQRQEFAGVIGPCINYLPLPFSIDHDDWNIEAYWESIRDKCIKALLHQDYPFSQLIADMGVSREASRNILFDVMFDYRNDYTANKIIQKYLFEQYPIAKNVSKLDLTLFVETIDGNCRLRFEYNSTLFRREKITDMASNYEYLLKSFAQNTCRDLSNLSIICPQEQIRIQRLETGAKKSIDKTVYEMVLEQARKTPQAVALLYKGDVMTYADLQLRVNEIANQLKAYNIQRQSGVAIHLSYCPDMLALIFAVMKCGAFFILLDKNMPDNRLLQICLDADIDLLVTDENLEGFGRQVPMEELDLHTVEGDSICIEEQGLPDLECPAYIVYTSGTTREPKGIVIQHKALSNYLDWARNYYLNADFNCRMALFTSTSFDLTFTSLFLPLVSGGTLVIYDAHLDTECFHRVVEDGLVNMVKITPSHIQLLTPSKKKTSIEKCILGGEALNYQAVRMLRACLGDDIDIYNEYGPAEATIGCMYYLCNSITENSAAVPIGKPIQNIQIFLLDSRGNRVPYGVTGQIHIAGESLFSGYLNQPELTASVLQHRRNGSILYSTGDYGQYTVEGVMEYAGRKDHQIKIRGHRVELSEIEKTLEDYDTVSRASVVYNGQELLAFLIVSQTASSKDYECFLMNRLPSYMIPNRFTEVKNFPVASSGKLDIPVLLEMASDLQTEQENADDGVLGEMEQMVSSAFQQVLGITTPLRKSDNFYGLGGDSIKAIQLRRVLQDKGLFISNQDIYQYQTIKEISICLSDTQTRNSKQEVTGYLRTTPYQNRLLRLYKKGKRVAILRLNNYDGEQLKKAFSTLLRYHNNLRATLNLVNNQYLLYCDSYSHMAPAWEQNLEQGQSLLSCLNNRTNLDVDHDFEWGLIDQGDEHYLYIEWHHALFDHDSWSLIFSDLDSVLRDYRQGRIPVLPYQSYSIRDYISERNGKTAVMNRSWEEHICSESAAGVKSVFKRHVFAIPWPAKEKGNLGPTGDKAAIAAVLMDVLAHCLKKDVCFLMETSIRQVNYDFNKAVEYLSDFQMLGLDEFGTKNTLERYYWLNELFVKGAVGEIIPPPSVISQFITLSFLENRRCQYESFCIEKCICIREPDELLAMDLLVELGNEEVTVSMSYPEDFCFDHTLFSGEFQKRFNLIYDSLNQSVNYHAAAYQQRYVSTEADLEDIKNINEWIK